jgi:hypothetical protein
MEWKGKGDLLTSPAHDDRITVGSSITAVFGELTYYCYCSAAIVRWVTESMWPFNIVSDKYFQSLMKTGRPGYYIPSPVTIAHDMKLVFVNAHQCIAQMLKEHEGMLNFATDAWSSPNHRAYVVITVHFEVDGVPVCFLLDLVEVAMSHTGVNLAAAFAKVLNEFGISDKVARQPAAVECIINILIGFLDTGCDLRQCHKQ